MASLFTTHPTGIWVYSSQVVGYCDLPVTLCPIHGKEKRKTIGPILNNCGIIEWNVNVTNLDNVKII